MKKKFACFVLVFSALLFQQALAEVDPEKPIEYIPYTRGNLIYPVVTARVEYRAGEDIFVYGYDLYFKPDGEQSFFSLDILTEAEVERWTAPRTSGVASYSRETSYDVEKAPPCIALITPDEIDVGPGDSLNGFLIDSPGLPSVRDTYTEGDASPPTGQQVVLPPTEPVTFFNSRTKVTTVGPAERPEGLNPTQHAEFVYSEAEKASQLGWLSSTSILNGLNSLRSSSPESKIQEILSILDELEAIRGDSLTDEGYFIIKPNLEKLLHDLGYAPPSNGSLSATQDAFLAQRNEHVNEGANALLTLEKVQGKATRSVVAFDLNNTDLYGLSRATLVLTVDPSQHVSGWGNGRTISARVLNSSWLEGNGKSFGLKKKEQIAGNGAGATWFSPSDEDVSNDSANSAVNWSGADASSVPTSPAVQIVNFQSGEVAFDVTADVLNGAEHGWLILKDQENVGSKVSFYSREGAAAAGNPDLAPRLLLEFGQVASNSSEAKSETLLSRIGFGSIGTKLRPVSGSEVRSVKQLLQENKVAALAVEQLVSQATLTNPVANWTTRLAYRSWISESIQIAANLEMARFQA